MNHSPVSLFESILSEMNWKEESESQIEKARSAGAHSPDNEKEKSKNKEFNDEEFAEEDRDKSKDEEEQDEEDIEDTEDDDEEDVEEEFEIKNGLEYIKLKKQINKFRSSHSIKDPEVNSELKTYFGRLSDAEKEALYLLMKGLTQVTLLDVSGKAAYIPSDFNLKISAGSSISKNKKKSIEKPQSLPADIGSDEINDIKNTPIVIGKSNQDESIKEIYNIVLSNA